jgi:hypothetical protein
MSSVKNNPIHVDTNVTEKVEKLKRFSGSFGSGNESGVVDLLLGHVLSTSSSQKSFINVAATHKQQVKHSWSFHSPTQLLTVEDDENVEPCRRQSCLCHAPCDVILIIRYRR